MATHIPLDQIEPDPGNVRVALADDQEDADLAASIRHQGVLQAIVVRRGPNADCGGAPWRIVFGHRRYKAAHMAGLTEIPTEIREFASEAEITLAQLAENHQRSDMAVVDMWAAIERAATEGLSDTAIALALNVTDRRVAQFRAMGRLHPDLQDYIRETGDLPQDQYLRVICQTAPERQAAVFQAMKGPRFSWWSMAAECKVLRIPLKHARFDPTLYTGPVFRDLFSTEDTVGEAEDPDEFLRLQREWAEQEAGRKLKAGFAAAHVAPIGAYGDPEAPKGCARFYYRRFEDAPKKKSERAGWIYTVTVKPDGQVVERCWPKPAETAPEGGATGACEAPPAPKVQSALTKAGYEAVDKAKREAAAAAVALQDDPWNLLAVTVALLADREGYAAPGIGGMVARDGTFALDHPERNAQVRDVAIRLARHALLEGAGHPITTAERVGQSLGGAATLPLTIDTLKLLNGPALERLRQAWGVPSFNTQKELRAKLVATGRAAIPADALAELRWDVEPVEDNGYLSEEGELADENAMEAEGRVAIEEAAENEATEAAEAA